MAGMGMGIMTGRVVSRGPSRHQRSEEIKEVSYTLSKTDGHAEDSRTKGMRQYLSSTSARASLEARDR